MKIRNFTPFEQRISRQSKNIAKLVRLYNATSNEKFMERALKLRQKYINGVTTITSTDTTTA